MFLQLFDGHSINIDDIRCIIPVERNVYATQDRDFITSIKKDNKLGYVFNWTKGKPQKSAIVTSHGNGKFMIYIVSISPELIQKKIDEHQGTKRKYNNSDFSQSEIDKDEKGR